MKSTFGILQQIARTMHIACLALASGVIVATGVAAAIAFPTMRDLAPSLPGLSQVDDNWMIAAGAVMAKVFAITGGIAATAIALSALALVIEAFTAQRRRPVPLMGRSLVLLLLVSVCAHYTAVLLPTMNHTFDAFVVAARANELDQAATLRAEFESMHPVASRELGAIAFLSLIAALLGAWPVSRQAVTDS